MSDDPLLPQILLRTWQIRNEILALKQQGMKLPEKVVMQGLWGRWIFGGSRGEDMLMLEIRREIGDA